MSLLRLSILKQNVQLYNIYYRQKLNELYALNNNSHGDYKVQTDYNILKKSDKKYSYHNIMFDGLPIEIIFADLSVLKDYDVLRSLFYNLKAKILTPRK